MNESQTQVLQNVAEMLKVARNGLTKTDFLQSFSNVVALVTKINKEMIKRQDDSFVQITVQFKALEKEVKATSKDDFDTLKTDLVSKVNTALKEQANGMKFVYDKVNALEDGLDGEDGKTPTKEELIALIVPLIPKVENGKDAEIDIDSIVAQVLQKLPQGVGNRAGWGAHPLRILNSSGTAIEKVARHIKFGTNLTATRSADGVVTINATGGGGAGLTELTATETPNGNLTVFTFAAASAQPTYIVSDNVWMKPTTKSGTVNWSWNAGALKATLTIPPTDEIFAFA